jgi:hypothetical protein
MLIGLLITIGLLLHPLGWDAKEVRDACANTSDKYKLGNELPFFHPHLTSLTFFHIAHQSSMYFFQDLVDSIGATLS